MKRHFGDFSSHPVRRRFSDTLSPKRPMTRLSPKRLSPKRLSPKRLSPKRLSPKRLSPKRLSPKRLSPKRLSPKRFVAETFCRRNVLLPRRNVLFSNSTNWSEVVQFVEFFSTNWVIKFYKLVFKFYKLDLTCPESSTA